VLGNGARKLLTQAVETEVAEFIGRYSDFVTEEGRRRVVRHGHLLEREIMTGIGPVPVRAPRVRDRAGQDESRIRFSSAILPSYARRSKSLEDLIPILYLRGISTGDFAEALSALLSKDAGGLSASTIARLKDVWSDEYQQCATFTCGLTASMSKLVLRTTRNACWSLLVRHPKAKRSSSA
jgi:putative transposase